MQPPISVSGKERRKRKPLVVDEEPIPVVEEPGLRTQDLGVAKGQPEVDTEDQIKEATVKYPDKPADILLTDSSSRYSLAILRQIIQQLFHLHSLLGQLLWSHEDDVVRTGTA